jgi:hypothetical protein
VGTRADFYVGRGTEAEWLGSIAWDGYPDGLPEDLRACSNEEDWRGAIAGFLAGREDGTLPEHGWPWPWNDSRTTDFAYAFDGGQVWVSGFGRSWRVDDGTHSGEDDDLPKDAVFPDMSQRKSVTLGPRSGLIVI